ncbi:MAG: 4-hydroxy-tetrahydrodipicolinate reductase [Candidatus Aegiribacteria sp.]|nr:4-hydroxy-tetrahydrodipicolinate reductase [Candidatus Aegiribacteria sp.]
MKLCVFGSSGRMGRLLLEEAGDSVIACYDVVPPGMKADVPLPEEVDVVLDFSLPSAWNDLDRLLSPSSAALVTGTTGLGYHEKEMLAGWVKERAVFASSNMSIGIYALGKLLSTAAEMLAGDFDLEIVECHHSGKIDSPSGTAITLAEIWENSGGGSSRRMFGRSGAAGPRSPGETGIHSLRGGDVVGDHQLYLLGKGERLLLSHSATGRRTFAAGALKAAEYLKGKAPGIYTMDDLMRRNWSGK